MHPPWTSVALRGQTLIINFMNFLLLCIRDINVEGRSVGRSRSLNICASKLKESLQEYEVKKTNRKPQTKPPKVIASCLFPTTFIMSEIGFLHYDNSVNLSSYVNMLGIRDIIAILWFKEVFNRCTGYDIWLILANPEN